MLQLRPTFSESWYRVVNLRAKLRPSAQISRQFYRGERWYVVRDPAGNQFHRLSDAAYRFVGLLDGSRTVGEAWELVGGQLDDEAPTQPEVIQILSQLHAANLLEADIPADANVLLRRHKMQLKRKFQERVMNVLFPRIPIWDPDEFLVRWMPVARLIFSKPMAFVWMIVVGLAMGIVIPNWSAVTSEAAKSVNPNNWIYLWMVFVLIKFMHELGHAFSCRRFGGECHEMGIMFLVFIPTPYVDASTAWAFPSRWHRMFVGAAGMIVELFIASLCAFVWVHTNSAVPLWGIPVHQLAYNAMLIASVSTVIFNANPLLRYDGYYMLSDFSEIPNLQQKSKEYLLGLIKRHVFRIKSQQPLPTVSQRIWLFIYGILSAIYRVFVGIMIILIVGFQVPILGYLMAIGGIVTWVFVPIGMLIKYLALEPELHRKRRAVAFTLAVTAAIVILVGFVPWWVRVEATGILEPEQRAVMHARAGGFVTRIVHHDGDWVKKDDVLIVCDDPDLDAQIAQTRATLRGVQAQADRDRVSNVVQWKEDLQELDVYRDTLDKLTKQKSDLTVRAPFDGELIAPELHDWPGRYLEKGQELFTVATMDKLLVRVALEQQDAQLASETMDKHGNLQLKYGAPKSASPATSNTSSMAPTRASSASAPSSMCPVPP